MYGNLGEDNEDSKMKDDDKNHRVEKEIKV